MALTKITGQGLGTLKTLAGSTTFNIDSAGHVTKPLQPAFLVHPASDQTNMANDATLVFGTEIYDQNADFASNTFTAPVTGKYLMCIAARVDQIDTNATWVRIEMTTSNRGYSTSLIDPHGDNEYTSIDFSIIVDMDASDTCYLRWGFSGGSATADLIDATRWSGALIC